jgi:hypothetical protein
MYRELEQRGQLNQALLQARDQTSDTLHRLLRQGVPYDQAWESVRQEWAFLPSEADLPGLMRARCAGTSPRDC